MTVGAWLDYACPFSAKFHETFVEKVLPHHGDDVRLLVYHQVQPWHPQSTMLHEAAIAVADVGGNDAFWKFSSALYATQTDFFDANAWGKSRAQIYDELAALAETSAGVSAMDVSARLARVVDPDGAGRTPATRARRRSSSTSNLDGSSACTSPRPPRSMEWCATYLRGGDSTSGGRSWTRT